MCGIVGVFSKALSLTQEEYGAFARAWTLAQDRGTDAAGWALWDSKEGSVWFWKSAGPSELGLRSLPAYRPGIGWIIGHTRYATSGHPSQNINNHPIVTGADKDLLGIHNGVIVNKDEILKAHEWEAYRQVDTEIIFRLLAHYGPDKQGAALRELAGSHCLAWTRHSDGGRLWLSRWNNPLHLWETKTARAFGSTERYFNGKPVGQLPEGAMESWCGRKSNRLVWRKPPERHTMADLGRWADWRMAGEGKTPQWPVEYYRKAQDRAASDGRQGGAYIDSDTGILEGFIFGEKSGGES